MAKEFDDILKGIHDCFSDFNGGIVERYNKNETRDDINASSYINEINRRLQFRESSTEKNVIDNEENYQVVKIMIPAIEIPEFKINMCKKSISIEENKIDDLCKKVKLALKKRYVLDEDGSVTFFDTENEEWRKISVKDPIKCLEDMGKVLDKGVKDTSDVLKTSFDNMKCNVVEMGKGIDKTVKGTVKKGSSKIQPVIKAQTANLNNKLQESYEDLIKQLEVYKIKVEESGKKLKKSTAQLSLQKELLNNIDNNLESVLKSSLKNIELQIPCVEIRKNTLLAGIEVKYPKRFEGILQTAMYLASKAAKGEMMEVILLKINNIVLNAKEGIKVLLKEAISAGIQAFIDSIKKSLELMNNKLINIDELIFDEINMCKSSDWIEVKYDFFRYTEILNEY